MIIGVLIRVILRFCRHRGLPVPDLSQLRRRPLRFGVADQFADQFAARADGYLQRRRTPADGRGERGR